LSGYGKVRSDVPLRYPQIWIFSENGAHVLPVFETRDEWQTYIVVLAGPGTAKRKRELPEKEGQFLIEK
jgi:hypothetical protein